MSATTLLERLAVAGVTLTPIDGGYLDAEGPLTDELRTLIRQHKAELLALLWNQAAPDQAFPRLDDLSPEGRAVGERIYRALLSPREDRARVCARNAQEEARSDDPEEAGTTLPASAGMCQIDREAFEERAAIREYDGGYSREDAELLAAWEMVQARFACLASREWLALHAPERLPEGDQQENRADQAWAVLGGASARIV